MLAVVGLVIGYGVCWLTTPANPTTPLVSPDLHKKEKEQEVRRRLELMEQIKAKHVEERRRISSQKMELKTELDSKLAFIRMQLEKKFKNANATEKEQELEVQSRSRIVPCNRNGIHPIPCASLPVPSA